MSKASKKKGKYYKGKEKRKKEKKRKKKEKKKRKRIYSHKFIKKGSTVKTL